MKKINLKLFVSVIIIAFMVTAAVIYISAKQEFKLNCSKYPNITLNECKVIEKCMLKPSGISGSNEFSEGLASIKVLKFGLFES